MTPLRGLECVTLGIKNFSEEIMPGFNYENDCESVVSRALYQSFVLLSSLILFIQVRMRQLRWNSKAKMRS